MVQSGEYTPKDIEAKWQKYWQDHKTFRSVEDPKKPKYYVLDMFPYPSGSGLHVGHPEGYTATDIIARYKRMRGFNVLHPMGWDAFGLPAEQHAIKTGTHPALTTEKNIDTFRRQIKSMGMSYDWDREINTTALDYVKWTQWIFLKLYEKGLAYESFEPVNWCEELGTVLANEEVIDGKSEVGGFPVVKKPMRQWVLKITAYADRLLEDLDSLGWSESIKEQQRNWIGRSIGAEIRFTVDGHPKEHIDIFTTRPDTLFGATFFVVAPEHDVLTRITSAAQKQAVDDYIQKARSRSDRERLASTEKTGVFTGAHVINPVNNEKLPIYVSDYVLISYGHGAVMAVPGHDERDHEFAKKFNLPIKQVLTGGDGDIQEKAHSGDGELINSGFLNGLRKEPATEKMVQWIEEKAVGKKAVNYKLRDWLFARQRYWGEPIPLLHDEEGNTIPVPFEELPVLLPEVKDYKPTGGGESPLANAKDWLTYKKNGKSYRRETNTMPQWAGSCWYYLRYIDPRNTEKAWDPAKEKYWMPVDLYVGGAEHAVLHLLYARFWHKVLFDLGLVSTIEPFQRLVNQGMILGENGEKMSKSRGNVVNPDDVIDQWGADSFRLYEMFMGPLEATKPWQTNGISGCNRFLKRAWRLFVTEEGTLAPVVQDKEESPEIKKVLHKTIQKVGDDIENLRFNTAIAAMMEYINAAYKEPVLNRESVKTFVLLLAPFAPHMGEELWHRLGQKETLAYEAWPSFDPALVKDDVVVISVQVNGKLRGTIEVPVGALKEEIIAQAKALESVARHIEGKPIKREIFVPGKIVNFAV